MKLLLTSDLHQCIDKWDDLVLAAHDERPRFVLIAGDLLPKGTTFSRQKAFFGHMRRCFTALLQFSPLTILTYLGNDDPHVLEPLLDELDAEGLCVNLNKRVHREEEVVFCGMNKVRDYPFGYKHWCVPDEDYLACATQFCGDGLTMDEQGRYVRLANLGEHLSAKPSIGQELDRLKRQLRPEEMPRSIWMVHQPPSGLGMDILEDGQKVGSPALLEFIKENQPLLGCSGHIHESPYQPGGRWFARVGKTLWAQPGQMGRKLHYAGVEINDPAPVRRVWHSIFGRAE